jgi:asparagine synthase (glutamine-hydrolysing)
MFGTGGFGPAKCGALMCGIVGAWMRQDSDLHLSESLASIAHRGPDGRGEYRDEQNGVVLGHVRLAIIDLSPAGAQPMASDDGQVVLVFNGEIYNFRELRAELEARGVAFLGHSDTEVLLRLYLADGLAILQRLNGIFAFAIYDSRSGELVLARDALGVKPLYYYESIAGFAFASEIKALSALTDPGDTLDLPAVHRYLSFLWCPGEGTPFVNVRKLPPGEFLRASAGRIVERSRWYTLPQFRSRPKRLSANDAVASVQGALRQAVQRQLVADVPIGAFLSGGLDSSAVVAFAREQVPDIRCFTIEAAGGGDAGDTNDLPYARRVAQHLGVSLDVVHVDSVRMAGDIERMVWQLDEPLADPAPLNVLYICELARSAGIKVLLSGAGGDDLFTGYRRHLALRYERLWSWLPPVARAGLGGATRRLDQHSALGRRLARLFAGADKSGDERLVSYFAWAQRDDLLPLYSAEVRAAVEHIRAGEPMLEFLRGIPKDRAPMDRMLALEQRFFLADHNLLYTDKMSMAVGVEVRVPFLDTDLVEAAARIPDGLKQRGRVGKWVLKKAMEPYLPQDIIYRPKTGFGVPLRRWMRYELRELLGDLLSEDGVRRRGLFDPQAVHRLITDNDTGRRDAAYTLLSLLCIEIWCRRFIDSRARAAASPRQLHGSTS